MEEIHTKIEKRIDRVSEEIIVLIQKALDEDTYVFCGNSLKIPLPKEYGADLSSFIGGRIRQKIKDHFSDLDFAYNCYDDGPDSEYTRAILFINIENDKKNN